MYTYMRVYIHTLRPPGATVAVVTRHFSGGKTTPMSCSESTSACDASEGIARAMTERGTDAPDACGN